jgi:DNA-binding CsgD family transcriptional regulator
MLSAARSPSRRESGFRSDVPSVTIGRVTAGEIAGRRDELAAVRGLATRADSGLAVLVLAGPAGIGKSTLWAAGVEAARERGLRVLAARPTEAERDLAFAGLGDLCERVLNEVGHELTPPQRRALEVALLVADATGDESEPRAVGVAVRRVLELASREAPVLLAIDDVQWLDPSSARALAFALRRLGDAELRVLLARRTGHAPTELEEALDPDRVERLPVEPLSLGATQLLLRRRLGLSLSRPALVRVHDVSAGNPFYALELGRALAAADPAAGSPVLPESLERLVEARLAGLPEETRDALVLAAAHGRPSWPLLRRAGVAADALEPALRAQVLEESGDTVRFAHPLLGSAVAARASSATRARAHAQLSRLVDDPVDRARHLALASGAPDAAAAATLEAAAPLARNRGAPIAAAELLEHAVRLTPPADEAALQRRVLAAGDAFLGAGDTQRVEALARSLLDVTGSGVVRARALHLLAQARSGAGDIEGGIVHHREALRHAETDAGLAATLHQHLARSLRFTETLSSAEQHARAASEIAERAGATALRAGATGVLALLRFNAGESDALALAEEAVRLGADVGDDALRTDVVIELGHVLMWSRLLARTRAVLEGVLEEWRDRHEGRVMNALWYLALVELRAGRWEVAAGHAEAARELGLQYTVDGQEVPSQVWPVALVALHRGDIERARELAELGRALATGRPALRAQFEATLGHAARWSGDPRGAVEHYDAAERDAESAEIRDPGMCEWRDEYVEALLQADRADDAVALLDAWEADARRLRREWVLAQAVRCRGLVAAAAGEQERAAGLLAEAAELHGAAGDPFGRARALLALGRVRRRTRSKRLAREALEGALAAFDGLGAKGWAETARAELGRIGGRTREEGLTAAERRVAALVADGRTNREVAAALFLGERTVETHLTHIYAKLGVRTRSELARVYEPAS